MSEIFSKFKSMRVIPVAVIERAEDAVSLAHTLVEGGLPCVEIVLRTPESVHAIRRISGNRDMLVGAGTVLNIDQAKAATDAGARFVVSPGFNPKVACYCIQNHIVHIPGVCTPTEIEAALDLGLRVLKFFPAEACGGLDTLAAISGPYQKVEFIPTGGINAGNLARYLGFEKVLACGGTWIADAEHIRSGRHDEILSNARRAVNVVRECRHKR